MRLPSADWRDQDGSLMHLQGVKAEKGSYGRFQENSHKNDGNRR